MGQDCILVNIFSQIDDSPTLRLISVGRGVMKRVWSDKEGDCVVVWCSPSDPGHVSYHPLLTPHILTSQTSPGTPSCLLSGLSLLQSPPVSSSLHTQNIMAACLTDQPWPDTPLVPLPPPPPPLLLCCHHCIAIMSPGDWTLLENSPY